MGTVSDIWANPCWIPAVWKRDILNAKLSGAGGIFSPAKSKSSLWTARSTAERVLGERLCRNRSAQRLAWDPGVAYISKMGLNCTEALCCPPSERCWDVVLLLGCGPGKHDMKGTRLAFLKCCGEKLSSRFCFPNVLKAHPSCTWDRGMASAQWGCSFGWEKPEAA